MCLFLTGSQVVQPAAEARLTRAAERLAAGGVRQEQTFIGVAWALIRPFLT